MPWRGPEEPGEFPTLGYLAVDWIESHLCFTDGPKMGEPIQLYDEQVRHFLRRYRLRPDARRGDGQDAFVHTGSMLVRGQKWGKDPLLAMDDIFSAFGPVMFDGWDAAGEPVGKPHPSPWVFVAALNDTQTMNTWLPLKLMVEQSDLVNLPGVEVTVDQVRLPGGNPIEKLTTTAFGRLGGRFTAGSLTENGLMTASGPDGNTGKRSPLSFARTLIRSVGGMGGMWMAATNTWDPTELSHAQQVYEASLKGRTSAYVDAVLSRARVELDDDEALRAELLHLYGDSVRERGGHVSTRRLMTECRNAENGENEVRRFYLSEILAGERPLVTPERWARLARLDDPLLPREKVTLGFDGSRSRDATVLTACRVRDGRIFHLRTWLPSCRCEPGQHQPEFCKTPRVDRLAVDQAVKDTFAGFDVAYLYADPYKWQDYLDVWSALFPGRVVEVPTNVETRMDGMVERFTTAATLGDLTHDGDADLAEHLRNTVLVRGRQKPSKPRMDEAGAVVQHYLKPAKKREGLRIDAAVSALLAYEARGQAVEEGGLRPTAPAPLGVPAGAGAPVDTPDWNSIHF